MSSQPDLTTQLVKHPRAPARGSQRRDRAARSATTIALRCWWTAFAVLAAYVAWAALWNNGVAHIDMSTAETLVWICFIDSLCLMVLSVVVAVLLGEKRTGFATESDRPVPDDLHARRTYHTALRCWGASFAIAFIGILAQLAWNRPEPPYDDSFGELIWFVPVVGLWCLLLFSALVATARGEARAQPALRARAAEVTALRASRGRLVDASDASRREIERNLHDGVQPRLVALLLNVTTARRAGELDGSHAVVEDIEHQLREILREIRAIASGILPPALTDLGLEAAVMELTACMPFAVDLSVPAERLPSRAEVTAYFVIAEALTNAAKHADPDQVSVSVSVHGERVTVEIRDNGCGGANADRGTGLLGLADRVDTLDGRLTVATTHGDGTTVTAEFSCAS